MSERIAQYQREREAVFLRWNRGEIGREAARTAIRTITKWIEKMAVGK